MKIAICTPVHSDTKQLFTICLARMLLRTARARFVDEGDEDLGLDMEVFMRSTSHLPISRQTLVEAAEKWGADWILWLDSDHTFPTDTLLRLLSHKRHVVGCNYPTRDGTKSVAGHPEKDGRRISIETNKDKAGQLEEAGSTGLGVCLVSMEAIRAAEPPLFGYETDDRGAPKTGEDVWFFDRLRKAGYPLFIDHGLSLEVGHIAERVLTLG